MPVNILLLLLTIHELESLPAISRNRNIHWRHCLRRSEIVNWSTTCDLCMPRSNRPNLVRHSSKVSRLLLSVTKRLDSCYSHDSGNSRTFSAKLKSSLLSCDLRCPVASRHYQIRSSSQSFHHSILSHQLLISRGKCYQDRGQTVSTSLNVTSASCRIWLCVVNSIADWCNVHAPKVWSGITKLGLSGQCLLKYDLATIPHARKAQLNKDGLALYQINREDAIPYTAF